MFFDIVQLMSASLYMVKLSESITYLSSYWDVQRLALLPDWESLRKISESGNALLAIAAEYGRNFFFFCVSFFS